MSSYLLVRLGLVAGLLSGGAALAVEPATTGLAPAKKTAAAQKKTPHGKRVHFKDSINWVSYTEAEQQSADTGKPIFVLIYAHWCVRCRELAPVFEDPELAKLAESVIMVRENVDNRADWLEQYKSLGSYLPRAFVLDATGTVRLDLNSGNRRYPLYYTLPGIERLKKTLRDAVKG